MQPELESLLQADVSSTELSDWARAELRRGIKPAALVLALQEAGWAPELATYFVQRAERASRGHLRRKAVAIAATGAAWLAAGVGAIVVGHQLGGTWSTQGPLLVGWGIIACGAMRLIGGMAKARRYADGAVRAGSPAPSSTIDLGSGSAGDGLAISASAAADLKLFGLAPGATRETVHQAYKDRAKLWHPDRFAATSELRSHAEKRMKLLNAAYARVQERQAD